MLSKWWGSASRYYNESFILYGKTDFITLESVSQQWDLVVQSLGLNKNEYQFINNNHASLQRNVFLVAIKNYWRDISLLTIEILLSWSASENNNLNDNSLALYIVAGLLSGRQWRSGGHTKEPLSTLTAPDYLTAKARQYAADSTYRNGYIARLDSFVEGAKDIFRPNMVSGRIYSYSGADDVESLQEAQLALLVILSSVEWKPSESLRRQLSIWTSSKFKSIEILKSRTEAMKSRLIEVENQLCSELVDCMLQDTNKKHTRDQGIVGVKEGINALLVEIEVLQKDAVSNAEVSDHRLNEIAMAASEIAFASETGKFPIQLFNKIIYDSTPREKFTLTFSKMRKGEFTDVEMSQRAINEEEYYAETVANQVGSLLLSDVVSKCDIRNVIAPDAPTYWKTLTDEAYYLKAQGFTPLLILDNPTQPDWIWEWQHPEFDGAYPRPPDLVIRREKNDLGDGYICDFNDIQIFSGPVMFGESLLVARETFSSVGFAEYKPNVFVMVETSKVPNSETLVDLNLSFERTVEIKFPKIVCIRYQPKP